MVRVCHITPQSQFKKNSGATVPLRGEQKTTWLEYSTLKIQYIKQKHTKSVFLQELIHLFITTLIIFFQSHLVSKAYKITKRRKTSVDLYKCRHRAVSHWHGPILSNFQPTVKWADSAPSNLYELHTVHQTRRSVGKFWLI